MPRPRRTVRRALAFDTFQQVLAEIAEVRKAHRTTGNWTIAQICKHLADSVNGSIDGFDLRQHRIKRTLFKGPLLWYTFKWGIPREYTVDPALTSDGGALLLREVDRRLGLTKTLAVCIADRRNPLLVVHNILTMLTQRVFGIALGYEDLNDHQTLRHDPLFAVVAEHRPDPDEPLASPSTLCRF